MKKLITTFITIVSLTMFYVFLLTLSYYLGETNVLSLKTIFHSLCVISVSVILSFYFVIPTYIMLKKYFKE